MWKNSLNDRVNQAAITAFDMAFVIGQKSYEGYEYYDFFEQVFERLKGRPFWSNLTSEQEAGTRASRRNLDKQRTIVVFTGILWIFLRLARTLPIYMMPFSFMQWD